ncbi:hypothetical protein [Dactylosporangium matsuzakiense]|uniref:Uncharacterized protein n=1 Tax=Dactylosporangium matsuzakiense TaxID=53360 RepID=A0A9W6NPV1_9ACTN|nr:hypothetical protein [Dactylosporangium matsuzakiense]UWZ44673.1 hypothetical protein Dmats_46345 [Dactylosporangium matsuzakiense]GLL04693.1 hypothetical protein GCM10017581_064400 [Dactylosporangium matsuzakiense]
MTTQATNGLVAAVSVTMQYAVPVDHLRARCGAVSSGGDNVARQVADAIGDGRVVTALRAVLPGAGESAASVRVTAGHVTVTLAPGEPDTVRPVEAADTGPDTVLLLPLSRTDPGVVRLVAEHQPVRPGWRCATCTTPWPCAIGQANLTATIHAGNGFGVGLALAGAIGRASLDQPDACPGCLTGQLLGWISDDLYTLMVAAPDDHSPAPTPHDAPRTRRHLRTRIPARHLPACPNVPPAADRLGASDHPMPAGSVCP